MVQRWVIVLAGVLVVGVVGVGAWMTVGGRDGRGDGTNAAVETLTTSSVATSGSVVSTVPFEPSTSTEVDVTSTTLISRLEVAETVGESPEDVELPVAEDRAATVAFLTGDGDGLVVFAAQTSSVYGLDVGDVAVCEGFAAELDEVAAAPVVLSGLATEVPDPVTSALFVSDIALKVRLLGACGTDGASSLTAEVAWQSELLERRLRELGVEW